jgi:prefoldin beta subunit
MAASIHTSLNIPLTELQTTIAARQTLESQLAENRTVSAEFSTLSDSSNIYKLIGPVLLKQDKTDAVASVNGRLEFIEKEIKRTEGRIKELQEGSEKKRGEVMSLQQKMLAGQQGQTQVKV